MVPWSIFIKYWRDERLKGLTLIEAGKLILEWEAANEKEKF
jgi:hypothetical protein